MVNVINQHTRKDQWVDCIPSGSPISPVGHVLDQCYNAVVAMSRAGQVSCEANANAVPVAFCNSRWLWKAHGFSATCGCFNGISHNPQHIAGYHATLSYRNIGLSCVCKFSMHQSVAMLECCSPHWAFVTAWLFQYITVICSTACPYSCYYLALTVIFTSSSSFLFFTQVFFSTCVLSKSPKFHCRAFSSR